MNLFRCRLGGIMMHSDVCALHLPSQVSQSHGFALTDILLLLTVYVLRAYHESWHMQAAYRSGCACMLE